MPNGLTFAHDHDEHLLPQPLREFVEAQVSDRGYSTSSEYVRELIRKDRDRERIRALLLEGAASPLGAPADDAYFADLRDKVRDRLSEK